MDWAAFGGFLGGVGAVLGVVLPWWRARERSRQQKRIDEFTTIVDGFRGIADDMRQNATEFRDRYHEAVAELDACIGERRGLRRRVEDLEEEARKREHRVEDLEAQIQDLRRRLDQQERSGGG